MLRGAFLLAPWCAIGVDFIIIDDFLFINGITSLLPGWSMVFPISGLLYKWTLLAESGVALNQGLDQNILLCLDDNSKPIFKDSLLFDVPYRVGSL